MTRAPIIAVVGPSGVGKDSVMEAMRTANPHIQLARRVITRPTAAGGEDFDGVDEATFARMVEKQQFALHWRAHGLRYGVPKAIEAMRDAADAVLVNLSRSVLLEAQRVFDDFRVINLVARPEVLKQRLMARGRESASDVQARLAQAAKPLPGGLIAVWQVDNSGSLDDAVAAALAVAQPVKV